MSTLLAERPSPAPNPASNPATNQHPEDHLPEKRSTKKTPAQFLGDRLLAHGALLSAIIICALFVAVAIFLMAQSAPALNATPENASIITTNLWDYAWPLLFGTVWASVIALVLAVPLSVGVALFTTHYAPRKLAGTLGTIIDLLAAVPSVVFGLWGIGVLAPALVPIYAWLNENLGWIPLFSGVVSGTGRTIFTAGIVLAVMILPLITALCREFFSRTAVLDTEAALALGATRWEMIRMAVLPPAKSGIVSASMLGLGRALGETMAVAMVLSATGAVSFRLLTSDNPSTIAANIALSFPEAYGTNINVLIATGLLLFVLTFAVNGIARVLVARPPRSTGNSKRWARFASISQRSGKRSGSHSGNLQQELRPASPTRRTVTNYAMTGLIFAAFAVTLIPLVSVIFTAVTAGIHRLDAEFFSSSMRNITGEGGGMLHALTGTLLITGAATIIAVPIGIVAAIYLVEYGRGRLATTLRLLVDVMTGIPSIVAGLFAYALFALILGPGVRLGIIGAVALALLMIPVVIRASEEMLQLVPHSLREASLALGVPKWRTVLKVVVPTALGGLITAAMLAISRVIGETAPLLLTAGFAAGMNTNLFADRMQSLPVYVYTQFVNQGVPASAYLDRAWSAALVLIALVLVINLAARGLAKVFNSQKKGPSFR